MAWLRTEKTQQSNTSARSIRRYKIRRYYGEQLQLQLQNPEHKHSRPTAGFQLSREHRVVASAFGGKYRKIRQIGNRRTARRSASLGVRRNLQRRKLLCQSDKQRHDYRSRYTVFEVCVLRIIHKTTENKGKTKRRNKKPPFS